MENKVEIILLEDLENDYIFGTDQANIDKNLLSNNELFSIYNKSLIKNIFTKSVLYCIEMEIEKLKNIKGNDHYHFIPFINSLRNQLLQITNYNLYIYNRLDFYMSNSIENGFFKKDRLRYTVTDIIISLFTSNDNMIDIFSNINSSIEFEIWEDLIYNITNCVTNNIEDVFKHNNIFE